MSRSQQRVCRLCEFPAVDSGVRVDAIDAQKLAEWCKQKLDTELEIATDAAICQFCIWDARFEHENSLGDCHDNESEHDWWTGNDNDQHYQQYFYEKPIIQPCRVELRKTSRSENHAEQHLKKNHQHCGKTILKSSLQKHFLKNLCKTVPSSECMPKVFKCEYDARCTEIFRSKYSMIRHVIRAHKIIRENLPCIYCGKMSKNQFTLATHICNFHSKISFKCRFHGCTFYFLSQVESDEHFSKEHLLEESLKKLQCPNCTYKTNCMFTLQTHFQRKHGVNTIKCQKCGKEFKGKNSLKQHFKLVHHQERCVCEHCGATLKKSSLNRHLLEKQCKGM